MFTLVDFAHEICNHAVSFAGVCVLPASFCLGRSVQSISFVFSEYLHSISPILKMLSVWYNANFKVYEDRHYASVTISLSYTDPVGIAVDVEVANSGLHLSNFGILAQISLSAQSNILVVGASAGTAKVSGGMELLNETTLTSIF